MVTYFYGVASSRASQKDPGSNPGAPFCVRFENMSISHFESASYAQIHFDGYLAEDVGYASSSLIIILDPEIVARCGAYLAVQKQRGFVK